MYEMMKDIFANESTKEVVVLVVSILIFAVNGFVTYHMNTIIEKNLETNREKFKNNILRNVFGLIILSLIVGIVLILLIGLKMGERVVEREEQRIAIIITPVCLSLLIYYIFKLRPKNRRLLSLPEYEKDKKTYIVKSVDKKTVLICTKEEENNYSYKMIYRRDIFRRKIMPETLKDSKEVICLDFYQWNKEKIGIIWLLLIILFVSVVYFIVCVCVQKFEEKDLFSFLFSYCYIVLGLECISILCCMICYYKRGRKIFESNSKKRWNFLLKLKKNLSTLFLTMVILLNIIFDLILSLKMECRISRFFMLLNISALLYLIWCKYLKRPKKDEVERE